MVCAHGNLKRQCEICERDETITALRGEVERLERVSERLDKKLAEEYVKTMKLEAALSRYRDAVEKYVSNAHHIHTSSATNRTTVECATFLWDELRRAGEGE